MGKGNKPREPGEYEEYHQEGIQKMWEFFAYDIEQKKVDRIIVIDDEGRCLDNMPRYIEIEYELAAIEQTRAGFYNETVNLITVNLITFPLIDVASSAAKKSLKRRL